MKTLFTGDICPTDYTRESFAEGDIATLFTDTAELFKEADFAFVNLECAITDTDGKILKYGPNLKAPHATAKMLKDLGVTVAGISNNHVFDFGRAGALDTLAALDEAGVDHTGFGKNYEDSRKDYIFEKNGERIAVIAVCEHEYSYALEDRMGSRPFDEFETIEDIRKAKSGADRVIVAYHGGKEMCHYPSPRLIRACRAMVRAGADLVMCQHTHCLGAYENYNGGHIIYGTGNFNFVSPTDKDICWHDGMAVKYDTRSNEIEIVPTHELPDGSGITVAKGEKLEAMKADIELYSNSLKDGTWKKGWHDFCVERCSSYLSKLAVFLLPEATEKERGILSHYLDCEAHNDLLREVFPSFNLTNEKD